MSGFKQADAARVYRFHDTIAVSIGTGPTQYLSLSLARQLAFELEAFGADIETTLFRESTLGTVLLTNERMDVERRES